MITGFRIWQLFYYSVVRTNEHLNIRTIEYRSVAFHKATASRLGISHYVRNDKPFLFPSLIYAGSFRTQRGISSNLAEW